MRTWSGSATARCSKVSDATLPGLSSLAADLRARGLRVGVGELLNAHLALASVDCSSITRVLQDLHCIEQLNVRIHPAAFDDR